MREYGERFVCDRCGREVFTRKDDERLAIEMPSGWGVHYTSEGSNKHLCDDCNSAYAVMIADFMGLRR